MFKDLRPNIVVLATLLSVVMMFCFAFGMDVSDALFVFVGGIIGWGGRLLEPPPDPSVPVSAIKELLELRG